MISRRNMMVGVALLAGATALTACQDHMMAHNKQHYSATLTAASEVPPAASTGKGTADVWYDPGSHTLSWTVTYSGLTGPATAAHFHGPAGPGANAGVVVPIGTSGMGNPVTGSIVLDDAKAAQLAGGQWYVNIHTDKNKGGEIRGQVTAAK
ncbi:MAG: CHRD domain-containing protein [Rhodospirillales bacterium]